MQAGHLRPVGLGARLDHVPLVRRAVRVRERQHRADEVGHRDEAGRGPRRLAATATISAATSSCSGTSVSRHSARKRWLSARTSVSGSPAALARSTASADRASDRGSGRGGSRAASACASAEEGTFRGRRVACRPPGPAPARRTSGRSTSPYGLVCHSVVVASAAAARRTARSWPSASATSMASSRAACAPRTSSACQPGLAQLDEHVVAGLAVAGPGEVEQAAGVVPVAGGDLERTPLVRPGAPPGSAWSNACGATPATAPARPWWTRAARWSSRLRGAEAPRSAATTDACRRARRPALSSAASASATRACANRSRAGPAGSSTSRPASTAGSRASSASAAVRPGDVREHVELDRDARAPRRLASSGWVAAGSMPTRRRTTSRAARRHPRGAGGVHVGEAVLARQQLDHLARRRTGSPRCARGRSGPPRRRPGGRRAG